MQVVDACTSQNQNQTHNPKVHQAVGTASRPDMACARGRITPNTIFFWQRVTVVGIIPHSHIDEVEKGPVLL